MNAGREKMSKMPNDIWYKAYAGKMFRGCRKIDLGHLDVVLLRIGRLVGEHGAWVAIEVLGGGLCEEGAWLDPGRDC